MGQGVYFNGVRPWMINGFRDRVDRRWADRTLHQRFIQYLKDEFNVPDAYLLNYTEQWVVHTFKG